MIYKPNLLPYFDTFILVLNIIALYFVIRMENINCLDKLSWKPIFLKNYTVLNIGITFLNMLVENNKYELIYHNLIRMPLHLLFIYVIYTYIRELENNMRNCDLTQSDKNIHEFLKFYSLVYAFVILIIITLVLSMFMSYLPRYRSIMNIIKTKKKIFKNQ